jgi:hypothetical protein
MRCPLSQNPAVELSIVQHQQVWFVLNFGGKPSGVILAHEFFNTIDPNRTFQQCA